MSMPAIGNPDGAATSSSGGIYSLIYFFAGAHKNGSHFQFYVLEEALKQRSILYRVVGSEIFHERDLNRAKKLFVELRRTDDIILCKGHWYRRREQRLLLGEANLKVFLIWRDLKDVLISSYHYKINKFGADYTDFPAFYFADGGRDLLIQQCLYRIVWSGKPVHETSYEALVDDFPGEAERLLSHAGIGDVDLTSLEAETGLGRLRETRNDQQGVFFRQGTTGQHRSFAFGEDVEADIERLLLLDHLALQRERCLAFAGRGVKKASSKFGLMTARASEALSRD